MAFSGGCTRLCSVQKMVMKSMNMKISGDDEASLKEWQEKLNPSDTQTVEMNQSKKLEEDVDNLMITDGEDFIP